MKLNLGFCDLFCTQVSRLLRKCSLLTMKRLYIHSDLCFMHFTGGLKSSQSHGIKPATTQPQWRVCIFDTECSSRVTAQHNSNSHCIFASCCLLFPLLLFILGNSKTGRKKDVTAQPVVKLLLWGWPCSLVLLTPRI